MPNLKLAAGAAATKSLVGRRKGTRTKRRAWLTAIKVAFLLERLRRRRQPQRSSPSVRQIALVVVSAGFAIMVIRVVLRRKGSGAGAQADTAQADTAQAETAQAETQAAAGEAASAPPTPGDDTVTATESTLTDTVQSEMSRRDDARAPASGAD
jgi:hypothetical protein